MKKFYLLKNFQVVYGLVLILLVPTVVVINTISLNRSFQTNIDVQLQRQALALGRAFNLILPEGSSDQSVLQQKLEQMISSQADVAAAEILEFQKDKFLVLASSEKQNIGQSRDDVNDYLVWYQNEAIATLVTNSKEGESGDRFWLIDMPLKNSQGEKQYILSLSVSLSVMDKLVKETLVKSYYILTLTVLFLLLLLAANSRLFEYALLYRKIKEVDKMKDEFISIASHELRTPLTVIKGYTSILLTEEGEKLSHSARSSLRTVAQATDRLNILVEDLLNVSRIEQNRLELKSEMVDVKTLVSEVVGELNSSAQEKGLNLKMLCRQDLPQIISDQAKLKQVLINVVGNAIKYTKRGTITVDCHPKNSYLEILTTDTGIGISAADRERLFEKFYRVKNDATQGVTGTGLGLWICKRLVEMMSGRILIDSIEGVGTQVSILLPLSRNN